MLPENHRMERLSLAASDLLAAEAGLTVQKPEQGQDYGVDGTFRLVKPRNDGRYRTYGIGLDFQAKSTEKSIPVAGGRAYDLERKTHLDLLERLQDRAAPMILIAVFLARSGGGFVMNDSGQLVLRGGVFWYDTRALPKQVGKSKCRIHNPEKNVLTPVRLKELVHGLNEWGGTTP